MTQNSITIKGACEHNLKSINLVLPRDKLIVFTGVSGSGKSSLAFDTIYAEGQRRYIESLSAYARQFLERMDKPDVEYIEGLSPAISIEQKTVSKNPRSTVGTVTEIYDYLRLLYARIGDPYCPSCGKRIRRQTPQQIVDQIIRYPQGTKLIILAPVIKGRKGEYRKLIKDIKKQGFVRVRIDGEIHNVDDDISLEKYVIHDIEIVVDRIIIKSGSDFRTRLNSSIETALTIGQGLVLIQDIKAKEEKRFSEHLACPDCGINIPELEPRMFSFNNPHGACPACTGLGSKMEFDPDLIIVDRNLSINEGALLGKTPSPQSWTQQYRKVLAKHFKFDLDTPVKDLPPKVLDILLYGSGTERIKFRYQGRGDDSWAWESNRPTRGMIASLKNRFKYTKSENAREYYMQFMSKIKCETCNGKRLRPESLAVKVAGKTIDKIVQMSIEDTYGFFKHIRISKRKQVIGKEVLKEINQRLQFLMDVGLGYLSINRAANTLSGGESQRIHLATQIGSRLVGVLYVLDEPSIGLHQRDKHRLIRTLKELRDLGNTIIVVEHDEDTIRSSDFIVDLGLGAGVHGGKVVVRGDIDTVISHRRSLTGKYLSGRLTIPTPDYRRSGNGKSVWVKGAQENNLKRIDVEFPLGKFIVVSGVSGSGKSTLVQETLQKALAKELHRSRIKPGSHDSIQGIENLDKVIAIDQSPIGRTPRSNPATYTKFFSDIREVFAKTEEARVRGYTKSRFSFNIKGGRCDACKGAGVTTIEMHFLPDISVPCEVCKGKRYNEETLQVMFKGKTITDVLDMTVEEALEFFENIPRIKRVLQTISDVGLGYITLGQPATTLSGGEAQRVKLARELSKVQTGRTLYILDEPTTGLHFADIKDLLDVLRRLVENGNTVIVVEHNLDIIKMADHIIDLGPEGGDLGGEIVAQGTPEEVMQNRSSYTGKYLQTYLKDLPAATLLSSTKTLDAVSPARDHN